MIASLYDTIGPWSWLILGLCLIAVEVLLPGIFFLWFALAAVVVGVVALFVTAVSWQIQIVLFLTLSCLAVLLDVFVRRGRKA
ncbi:NfeD family protein [Amorphus sp. 3PC139-8]|uniref:NfeD family protein n=1 Tax=Amorphus sp. 3PC139-8 TaxID=2735676 RepID=UPI00345D5B12